MSLESTDVRIARLEEAMVSVKGDTHYIRKYLDDLSGTLTTVQVRHSFVSGKIVGFTIGIAGLISAVTSLGIHFAIK